MLNIALSTVVGHSSQVNSVLTATVVAVIVSAAIVHEPIVIRVVVEVVESTEVAIEWDVLATSAVAVDAGISISSSVPTAISTSEAVVRVPSSGIPVALKI